MSKNTRFLIFALSLVLAVVGLRWRSLDHAIWSIDEGSTFTMGAQILHGEIPYLNAADNRNPLAPYAKAVIYAMCGEWNARAVHIVVAMMLGLAATLLWRFARRLGDNSAGIAGALWFVVLNVVLMAPFDSMAAHTGWFLVFFSCLGFWLFARTWSKRRRGDAIGCGVAFAFAFLAKQPGLLDFGVVLVVLALGFIFQREQRRPLLVLTGLMLAGFVAPIVLTAVYFAARGGLHDFMLYSWTYNAKYYVPEVPLLERLSCVRVPFRLAFEHAPAVLLAAPVAAGIYLNRGIRGLVRRPAEIHALAWLNLGWLASGLVSTALSGRTFDHYSMQLIAPLSLACGWTTARLVEAIRPASRKFRLAGVGVMVVLAGAAASVAWQGWQTETSLYPDEKGPVDLGAAVRQQTKPTDRIFVWGYAPEIYFFSQRLPATRFIYTNYLTGLIPWTNLDPQKNTDYAIIPGAWDEFWTDWEAHPPELIVDTLAERGYLKYPLEKQARLWPVIRRDYAEVDSERFRPQGRRLFRRAVIDGPRKVDPDWPVEPGLQVLGLRSGPQADRKFTISAPLASRAIELYLDDQLYRHITGSDRPGEQVVFTVLAADLPPGKHVVQAVAIGQTEKISRPYSVLVGTETRPAGPAGGPPLLFEGQSIAATETETFDGSPVGHTEVPPVWDAHAPSRMVYPRPAEMDQVLMNYGMHEEAYGPKVAQKTDGYEVVVVFEDENGDSTRAFYRRLDPVHEGRDRGPQTDHFTLPLGRKGTLTFLMTSGPMNDATSDWTYWESIKGYRGPLAISFRGKPIFPLHTVAPLGAVQMDFHGKAVILAHAPSHFDFPLQEGIAGLSGSFGLMDNAWNESERTIGAVFEIIQIRPDGSQRMLMQRSLEPAKYTVDRGMIPFDIKVPQPADGILRLVTRSPEEGKNDHCYTFWSGLTASEFHTYLRFDGRNIASLEAHSDNGVSNLEEDGKPTLLAHAPSRIVFPLEPGMHHFEAEYGMLRGSFARPGDTDGAVFVVEVESAAGERRELFRRYLNPMHEGAHQSPQKLTLDLPDLPGGHLILRTEAAPSGRLVYAWSFWRNFTATR
ncbi:MAG TPA: glycosyltransferase family 39 protein [Candidatus Didemnitutus sp.]|nr:glycosyltransferase family 39 protein [Candidatus Didemnitutus sp.]